MEPDINLEYYKIFYYVGKLGSITLASEQLSLSQPAVSQSIRNLENQLGVTLFVRSKKGVRFTDEGELLFSYIANGYEIIRQGEKKIKQMQDLNLGEIHIGASDMTLQYYLLPYLEQFHKEYPDIKITVTNAPTPETLKHLQDGKIDFGVISTPFLDQQPWRVTATRQIRDIFVAGKQFFGLKDHVLSYKDLEELPIICLEGETSTRKYVEAFLQEQMVQLHPEFELATSNMLVQFALRGLGVACVVEDFAKEYLESGELFELQFDKQIPEREICVISDDRIPKSVATKKLLDIMNG